VRQFLVFGVSIRKKGMGMADLSAEQGLFLRLGLSALLVLLLVLPRISQYGQAWSTPEGKKGMLLILAFEGVVAGTLGMRAFYTAIRQGELSRVVPLAFTMPFWGFLLGVLLHGEKVTALKAGGVAAMLLGIVLLNL
jgi:uncharacterized membrane protein